MRNLRSSIAIAAITLCGGAQAQVSDGVVKIGVLTDMAGPYSGMGGKGSVIAAKMAVDDCLKAECKGMKIEVLSADHQNKADIAASKAREWIDTQGISLVFGGTNSATALARQ